MGTLGLVRAAADRRIQGLDLAEALARLRRTNFRASDAVFAEILRDFCDDHRITKWKREYTTFRNNVFHGRGVPGPTLLDQYSHIMDVAHFCDSVVLALLNWDAAGGRYVPCNEDTMTYTDHSLGVNLKPFMR